jgi:hypothetical protein
MAFDVFISHSSDDKQAADATCAALEAAAIRCWIAPRDVRAGREYAEEIINAIDSCRVMVLIFSSSANASNQVRREIERAVSKGVTVVTMRIEDVLPSKSMEYYLGSIHWLDALTPPLVKHLRQLTETVKANLEVDPAGRPPSAVGILKPVPNPASAFWKSKKWPMTGGLFVLILLCVGVFIMRTLALPDLFSRRQAAPTQTQEILRNIVLASYDEPLDSSFATNSVTLKPLNLNALSDAILAGYSPELLLWLFTDQFRVYLFDQPVEAGYRYDPPGDYGCSEDDPRHRCYVDWVNVATILGLNVEHKIVATPNAITYSRFCFDRVLGNQAKAVVPTEIFQAVATRLDLPISTIYDSPLSCGGDSWNPAEVAGEPQPEMIPLIFSLPTAQPPIRRPLMGFSIYPRSVDGMFKFLGTLLRVQRDQIKPSRGAYVPPGRDDVTAPPTLVTVRSDPKLLTIVPESEARCFVEARVNDTDYCVPATATTTKNIFSFLSQILGKSATSN